jgi:hypothetical protein
MRRYSHILGVILLILLILATFAIYAVDAQGGDRLINSHSDDPYPGETPIAPYPGEEGFLPMIIKPDELQ